jgi:hypothetical protein
MVCYVGLVLLAVLALIGAPSFELALKLQPVVFARTIEEEEFVEDFGREKGSSVPHSL